jgi:YD repeat-containing protein
VPVDELACLGTEDRSEGGMMNETTFDANGNIVEQTVDNGDGTGTRTVYDADGNVTRPSSSPGCRSLSHPNRPPRNVSRRSSPRWATPSRSKRSVTPPLRQEAATDGNQA